MDPRPVKTQARERAHSRVRVVLITAAGLQGEQPLVDRPM